MLYWVTLSNKSISETDPGILDSALISIDEAINFCDYPEESLIPNKASILYEMGGINLAFNLLEALPSKYRNENLKFKEELRACLKTKNKIKFILYLKYTCDTVLLLNNEYH